MVRSRRTRQVLIIDDDPHIAETIVAALKDRYLVHVASDDREGLALLRRHPIDLLVLDVRLKSTDGLDGQSHGENLTRDAAGTSEVSGFRTLFIRP